MICRKNGYDNDMLVLRPRLGLRKIISALPTRAYHVTHTSPCAGDRVVIGMSGGVDSSVAAKLLADQDYDLSAVFMRNWDTRDELGRDSGLQTGCEWEKDWQDVQSICRTLDIPCKLVDLSKEYWNRVFEPALEMWENGQTPNPDVWCNRHIKFGHLLHTLQIVESNSWFATGHYARKAWSSPTNGVPPRPKLLRFAADPIKDQSLFLSSIKESALSRALFPLGDAQLTAHLKNVPSGFPETHGPLNKSHVKALAKHWGLVTAEKEESMGLCFVGERGKFHNFISSYLPPKPGPIVQIQNDPSTRTPIERVVGTHSGLWNYTIGQNARVPGLPQKTFVSRKNADSNTLFVVFGGTNEALYAKTIWLDNASWIWQDSPPVKLENLDVGWTGWIKARHRMVLKRCRVVVEKESSGFLRVEVEDPLHGIAPGQVVALYADMGDGEKEGSWCLGCATIVGAS